MPRAAPHNGRPIWLMTLADLALLLVGFFVFIQATARQDAATQAAVAASIRSAFGGSEAVAAAHAIALDANILPGFAPGSAALPRPPAALVDWARSGARDVRTRLTVTGYIDGSPADGDLGLAAARAVAVAGAIEAAGAVPGDRIQISAMVAPPALRGNPAARRVTLSVAFAQ